MGDGLHMPLSGSLDWPLDFALSSGSGRTVPWGSETITPPEGEGFDYGFDSGMN